MAVTPKWAMEKGKKIIEEAKIRYEQAKKQIPAEYHEFVVLLPQNVKVSQTQVDIDSHASELGFFATKNGTYVSVSYPYMAVNGRVKMARDDHRKAGKLLHFNEPAISNQGKSLSVTIESELLGKATGSSLIPLGENASGAERDNPLEVAETSAIGRALGFLGYGLIGTGIASAEEMDGAEGEEEDQSPEKPTGDNHNNSSGNNNSPSVFRIKVLDLPKFNRDGSCIFHALTHKRQEVEVVVTKQHKAYMDHLGVDQIINVTGWLNNDRIRVDASKAPVIEGSGAA